MKADNQMNNVHQIEPRSENGNLPPELKAMQTMMDMVFGAIAAPRGASPQNRPAATIEQHSGSVADGVDSARSGSQAVPSTGDVKAGSIPAGPADNAAPRGLQPIVAGVNPDPAGAAPDDEPYNCQVEGKPCDRWCGANPCLAEQPVERRIDIETAIMRAPGFDYLLASEIFAALQRRLEVRYEDRLDMVLETMMQDLATAFDRLTGMGK